MSTDGSLPPRPSGIWIAAYPPYRRETAPATVCLVASTIAVYFVQLIGHFFLGHDWIGYLLAFSPATFLKGAYWQLVSYAWIHSIELPVHIIFNMIMVWVLGGEIERIIGSLRFLVIYLGGAITAALAFWCTVPFPFESVAGASGSAFALLTSLAVLCPRRRLNVLLLFIIPMRMTVRTLAIATCAVEVVCLIFGWLPFISHTAHLGGALGGLALTYLLRPPKAPLSRDAIIFPTGYFPPH